MKPGTLGVPVVDLSNHFQPKPDPTHPFPHTSVLRYAGLNPRMMYAISRVGKVFALLASLYMARRLALRWRSSGVGGY